MSKFVDNKLNKLKSLAVWMPVLAITLLGLAENAMDFGVVPDDIKPFVAAVVVLLSAYTGRIIKQKSIS